MNYGLVKNENLGESFEPTHSVATPPEPPRLTRIQKLEKSDADIEHVKTLIVTCVGELTKEKQISRLKFDEVVSSFKKTVQEIEGSIDTQLNHLLQLSVGGSHETMSWGNRQQLALAKETNMHLHHRLKELLHQFDFPTNSESRSDSVAEEAEYHQRTLPKEEPMSPGDEL